MRSSRAFTATALAWTVALALAAWAVSAARELLADSPPTMQWSEPLQLITLHEGQTWRRRSEGHGVSRVGKLGILGVPDAPSDPRPAVLVWGDSFIEAAEVSDAERLPQVLTQQWNAAREPKILAIGIGAAGRSVADIIPLIPRYERVLPQARVHLVFLPGLGDLLPDSSEAQLARFTAEPELRIIPGPSHELTPLGETRQVVLRTLGLRWLASQASRVASGSVFASMRFRPGPAPEAPPATTGGVPHDSSPELEAAVAWILERLDAATDKPLALILMPRDTPALSSSGVVLREAPTPLEVMVARRCAERGIGFIDLREPFNAGWREGRGLPRGFENSRPGDGHMNALGHAQAAGAVAAWLQEHDAVLAP